MKTIKSYFKTFCCIILIGIMQATELTIFSSLRKVKNQVQIKEKFSTKSNCYALDHFREYEDHIDYLYIGKNQITGMFVFGRYRKIKKNEDSLKNNIYPNRYNYYSTYRVSKDYFPEILRNKYFFKEKFYFSLLYKKCIFKRAKGEVVPSGFEEKKDENLRFWEVDKCNYICRTIYIDEKGLCISDKREDSDYTCTYLIQIKKFKKPKN